MTILPLAYLPSVEWVAHAVAGDATVDLGEHFIKRSCRNRARILAVDGVMELTAQVTHANRPQQPMREVRLDYSKRWQHQHWGALVASYKRSPYFDHYADRFEGFYHKPYPFLVDYNLALLECLMGAIHQPLPALSERYLTAAEGDLDLRPRQAKSPTFTAEPYTQVFEDRLPFAENLSFIDLLFSEGPASVSILRSCLSQK